MTDKVADVGARIPTDDDTTRRHADAHDATVAVCRAVACRRVPSRRATVFYMRNGYRRVISQ